MAYPSPVGLTWTNMKNKILQEWFYKAGVSSAPQDNYLGSRSEPSGLFILAQTSCLSSGRSHHRRQTKDTSTIPNSYSMVPSDTRHKELIGPAVDDRVRGFYSTVRANHAVVRIAVSFDGTESGNVVISTVDVHVSIVVQGKGGIKVICHFCSRSRWTRKAHTPCPPTLSRRSYWLGACCLGICHILPCCRCCFPCCLLYRV